MRKLLPTDEEFVNKLTKLFPELPEKLYKPLMICVAAVFVLGGAYVILHGEGLRTAGLSGAISRAIFRAIF
jgi:hypothetical protein